MAEKSMLSKNILLICYQHILIMLRGNVAELQLGSLQNVFAVAV